MSLASWAVTALESVVLDGTGAGSVLLGPVPPQREWCPLMLTVSGHGAGTADIYLGPPDGAPLAHLTTDPSVDQLVAVPQLLAGQYLTVVWAGGTIGHRATAALRASGRNA